MQRSEIQALLPGVFQQTLTAEDVEESDRSVLSILIDIMHLLHTDIEEQASSVADYFNPCRTPQKDFVDFLGYWTDLDRLWSNKSSSNCYVNRELIAQDCLQELIASAAFLSQWRGTKKGLCHFLNIATGSNNISIQENINKKGEPQAFHFLVLIAENQKQQLKLIKTIIEQEKPVYISYEIKFFAV